MFFAPLIGLWHSLKLFGAPWSFLAPPNIFSLHRLLMWSTYGTFLQPNNFNSKFWRPFSWRSRRRRGNLGYFTPLSCSMAPVCTMQLVSLLETNASKIKKSLSAFSQALYCKLFWKAFKFFYALSDY